MTRDPILNAMIQRERLAADLRATRPGDSRRAGRILAALRKAVRQCLGGGA